MRRACTSRGYVADAAIGDYLAASDACLCLRWPTALETSASWLQCLAAARPTVISDLAHLVDIPTLDPRSRRTLAPPPPSRWRSRSICWTKTSRCGWRCARWRASRSCATSLARAGHAYWSAHHTLDVMADDYQRLIANAAARPAPVVTDLPAHFTDDHSQIARAITQAFGIADF